MQGGGAMKYRPEIDGLRSLAVLPVIFFHGGLSVFSGGFVGVDVFFVISGYLITTIILSQINEGRFSLMTFYARRARRILPALFLVVLCTLPFAWLWMLPTEFKDFSQSIAAVSLFSSNFLFWMESGYFAAAAEQKPLLHTWSLAVEEQYYILFPLLLIALWRRSALTTTLLLGVIFVLSLAGSEWLYRVDPEANFYLLPTRAWELLMGSLCAILTLNRGPQRNNALALIGLILILGSVFVYDKTTPFPSLWAVPPVLGTGLVLVFATHGTWVARLLSMRGFVGIGLISYSAYLWHQPLFALARLRDPVEPSLSLMMGLAFVSLGLAYLSWRFVEQPARQIPWAAWKVMCSTVVVSGAVLVLGAVLSVMPWQSDYFRSNLSVQNQPLLERITQMRTMDHFTTEDTGRCQFYIETFDQAAQARFETCARDHGRALIVFGDSHSIDVYKGLVAHSDRPFLVGFAQGPCRPSLEGAPCDLQALPEFLVAQASRIERALYVQAGFWLLTDAQGVKRDRHLFADEETDARLDRPAIARVVAFLQEINTHVPVVWVGPRIEPHVTMDRMLGVDCDVAPQVFHLSPSHLGIFRELDAFLAQATAQAGVDYLSEIDSVGFDAATELYSCDALYWSDGDHWSPQGEDLFGGRLTAALVQAYP
jgi:peptidoglycan/LPS O-acetylase OafA/YrhL